MNAMTHDASTLGGNSGSAVIDVESGEVIALHFVGADLRANYAVPMYTPQVEAKSQQAIEAGGARQQSGVFEKRV